jgi:hypothetical protein
VASERERKAAAVSSTDTHARGSPSASAAMPRFWSYGLLFHPNLRKKISPLLYRVGRPLGFCLCSSDTAAVAIVQYLSDNSPTNTKTKQPDIRSQSLLEK